MYKLAFRVVITIIHFLKVCATILASRLVHHTWKIKKNCRSARAELSPYLDAKVIGRKRLSIFMRAKSVSPEKKALKSSGFKFLL